MINSQKIHKVLFAWVAFAMVLNLVLAPLTNIAYASEAPLETDAPLIISETETTPLIEEVVVVDTAQTIVEEVSSATEEVIVDTSTSSVQEEEVVEEQTEVVVEPVVETVGDALVETSNTITEVTEPVTAPQLTTDKADYAPTELVTIFGKFFQALKSFVLYIVGGFPDGSEQVTHTDTVTSDVNGDFIYQYQLDGVYRPDYTVTASDSESGAVVAQTTFTDAAALGLNLDQCQNNTLASLSTACGTAPTDWANGNINGLNSQYREGDGVPYRFAIEKLGNGTWFVRVQYDFTQGGKFALDRLTQFDLTQNSNPCQGVTGCVLATIAGTVDIPSEVASTSATAPALPNGGDLDVAGTASNLDTFFNGKKLTVWNYGSGTVTPGTADANVTQSGLSTGNSSREFKFSITTAGCPVAGCKVMIGWTGHISSSAATGLGGWGAGNGASFITGAPFHMRVLGVDATNGFTGGNQDRSVQLSAIVSPSTITIHKVTSPSGGTGFAFTTTGTGYAGFTLDDGQQNQQSVLSGSFSVTETNPSPTYTNTALTCTASGTGSSAIPTLGTRSVAITIGSGGGAVIDCIYTNTLQQGTLIIDKVAVGGDATFGYSVTGPTASTQSIITSGGNGTTGSISVNSGSYVVSENTIPSGWDLTNSTCTNGTPASFTVTAGQTTTCTFTNTKHGSLKVTKNAVGGDATFSFPATGTAVGSGGLTNPFTILTVSGVKETTFSTIPAGSTYSITESSLSGWITDSSTCSGTIIAGAESTCTFTNTKKPTLTVNKILSPSIDPGLFNLQIDGSTAGTGANVGDTGTTGAVEVSIGAHTVSETAGTSTTLTDYTSVISGQCALDGSITLAAGENKVCTITNTRNTGTIELKKVWSGTGGQTNLNIGTSNGGLQVDTQLTGSNGTAPLTTEQNTVNTGTYFLSENGQLTNYTLSALVCFNDADNDGVNNGESSVTVGANDSVSVLTGQHVICSYTNTRNTGTIIVQKVMIGGTSTFDFTGTPNGSISANNGTIQATVDTGAYSSTEAVEAGWDLTSISCDDGASVVPSTVNLGTLTANFNVESGETVTCTFTNTKRGHIIVVKNAITNDAQDFVFANNFGNSNPSSFTLDDDSGASGVNSTFSDTRDSEVLPGSGFSVTETIPSGWKQFSVDCGIGNTNTNLTINPGQTITCTFVNHKLATIVIVKNTIGGNDTFGYTTTGGSNFPTNFNVTTAIGTGNEIFNNIDPDLIYSIAETGLPSGWAANGVTCQNESVGGSITSRNPAGFQPTKGGIITCTFTNNKPVAQIDVTPLTDTNKIGDNHVITASVQTHNGNGTWGPAVNGTVVTFVISNSNGATAVFVPATPNTCTTTAGSCSITINSATTGTVSVNASATPVLLGVNLPVSTGTGGDNSANAQKDYVNARISITPTTDTNAVNDSHTFTITVSKDTGSGFTGISGANPVVTFSPSNPGTVTDNCVSTGTDVNGQCTVVINSAVAGIFTANATLTTTVNTVVFNLTTNGLNGNSVDAVKTYVDASIALSPLTATNEVNQPHTITATVTQDDGAGVDPAVNITVTFSVTLGTATFVGGDNNCVTNGSGVCSVDINSSSTGSNTINATTTFLVGGVSLTRATDGDAGPDGTVAAAKTYVDANIILSPLTATNNIGDPHTITATVSQDPGTGFVAAPNGTLVTFSLPTNTASAVFVGGVNTCTTTAGTCSVSINSSTPGNVDIHATTTFTVGGVSLTRATDGTHGSSVDANKVYVAGSLQITKIVDLGSVVNPSAINDTFTVTVTGPSYPGGTPLTFTVTNGVLQTPTSVTLSPIIPGDYTITEVDAGTEWTETVPAGAVTVVANQTAQATVTNTYVPGSLQVNKVVELNGYLIPTGVDLDFTINVTGPSYPVGTPVVINVVDGVPTNSPQVLADLIPGAYTVSETNPGIAWTVTGEGDVTVNAGGQASVTVTNSLKIPSTLITMTPDVFETTAGGNVILTITDTNNGQVPITSPSVQLLANNVLTIPQPTFVSESGVVNGIIDLGETWTWTWTGTISVNTIFTVNGIGTDPLGNPVNGPTYASETTSQTVTVIGTTRTIGFWQTHTTFTSSVFSLASMQKYVGVNSAPVPGSHKGTISNITSPLGQSELFGGFYALIAKKADGTKRLPIDQARIQMLQQLLAAKLNCAAFECSSATLTLITDADAAYLAGASKSLIISLAGQLDLFNNSGDSGAIPPALGATGKATPTASQSYANTGFWNQP